MTRASVYRLLQGCGLLIILLGLVAPAQAAPRRVALVIGNAAYQKLPRLLNPSNDAADLSNTLKELGYDVIGGEDLSMHDFRSAVRDFVARLDGADAALLFYAGHGIEIGGTNYMLPVNAELLSDSDIVFDAVPVQQIIGLMESHARTSIVILDACRENPLRNRPSSATRGITLEGGLAPESGASGTYIVFAAQPGAASFDGTGRNSPFTGALLRHIREPGEDIRLVMADVREDVLNATAGRQRPWDNGSLAGRFYLNPTAAPGEAEVKNTEGNSSTAPLSPKTPDVIQDAAQPTPPVKQAAPKKQVLETRLFPPGTPEGLVGDVPIPGDVRMANPADVPAQFAKFAGAFAGRWDGRLDHVLVVEDISRSGYVNAIYAYGDQKSWSIKRGWDRIHGAISGNRLSLFNSPATYDLMEDGRLSARYHGEKADDLESAVYTTMFPIDLRKALKDKKLADWEPNLPEAPGETPVSFRLSDADCEMRFPFGSAEPASQGVNPQNLLALTRWVKSNRLPIFSILVSRNGKVVYELYTSGIKWDAAHYLMSVTKSVTSALVGRALGEGLLGNPRQNIADLLPHKLLPSQALLDDRFKKIDLKKVMGMSALDAMVFHDLNDPDDIKRSELFQFGPDRLRLALNQKLLPNPGSDFLYTDITPQLAGGAIQYAAHATLLDYAKKSLFDPMGFRNEEWMHEDKARNDNAAYGFRLRPIDMQKFGVLYLNEGCWNHRQLLAPAWVSTSFTPWIASHDDLGKPDYGWFWWRYLFADGWVGHVASGWKGQRIAVFRDKKVIVTMTGAIEAEDGNEDDVFAAVMNDYVIPAVDGSMPDAAQVNTLEKELVGELSRVKEGAPRFRKDIEPRMIPSVRPKEMHRPFIQ